MTGSGRGGGPRQGPFRLTGQRVLVVGSGGFIGRHLIRALLGQGARVAGWDKVEGEGLPEGLEQRRVDVGDPAAVQAAFATGPFDATIHLASRGAAINSMVGAVEDARLTAVVTEQGAAAGRSGHLILFGSADQYGRAPAPQSPATPTDPINAYGLAKDLSDAVAAHARPRVPAPISVLRPFSVYGPGQPPRMFLSQLAVAIEAGTEFRMSAGTQVRDFVHVSDVCQAVVLLLGTPEAAGRTWNVGTGHGISLREAVDLLCDAAGARIPVRIEGAVRADDPPALVADASETRQRLGWRPAIDLVSGFRGMLGGSGAGDAP